MLDPREPDRLSRVHTFAPLDSSERLPREQLLASRRYRRLGRPEIAGSLWLPALVASLTLLGWLHAGNAVALAASGLLLFGLALFALREFRSGR